MIIYLIIQYLKSIEEPYHINYSEGTTSLTDNGYKTNFILDNIIKNKESINKLTNNNFNEIIKMIEHCQNKFDNVDCICICNQKLDLCLVKKSLLQKDI